MEPHTSTTLNVHDTPAPIFEALKRIWPVTSHGMSTWISVPTADGVTLTFFSPREDTSAAPPEA